MTCAYCPKPATFTDLCHGPLPVCDEHAGAGHQLEALEAPPPKRAAAPEAPVPLTVDQAPRRRR